MVVKTILLCCIFVFCYANEFEGDLCTKDGKTGTCVVLGQCKSAIADIRRKKRPQICGFVNASPIVCCLKEANNSDPTPDESKKPGTNPNVLPIRPQDIGPRFGRCDPIPEYTSEKIGQKAFDKCIEYQEKYVYPCEKSVALTGTPSRSNYCHHNADDLIYGGNRASRDEFPHMAMLRYGHSDIDSVERLCGGTIISEKYVLTAGHCISTNDLVEVSHIIVGVLTKKDADNKTNIYEVNRVIKHPNYESPLKYNDIALLETKKPIKLSSYIVPACLHIGDPVYDDRVLATGWGLTNNGSTSDTLQKVILRKFTEEECSLKYGTHRHFKNGIDHKTQICYGDKTESKDTCQGDSGGPIQIKSKKIHCMYTIVGIVSFGKGCGHVGEPAIYTKLSPYLRWIESIAWP